MTSASPALDQAAFTSAADAVLASAVEGDARVPGVVAMVTDRDGNIYEGAAGVRRLGTDNAITTDDVFAIFSTTKAFTATAALQLVEAGQLDLDAPASDYAPKIGELQVLEGFDDAGNPVVDRKGTPRPDPKRRDTENVPFTYGGNTAGDAGRDATIKAYFAAEVLPHVPDAWIDEKKTKVGYEIPFTRHFYKYIPPRPLAEIDADLEKQVAKIMGLLREVEG